MLKKIKEWNLHYIAIGILLGIAYGYAKEKWIDKKE